MLNELRLKTNIIASWRQGGMESLVKVMPRGTMPDPNFPIGYCTKFKYIAGRTPREIERIVGFAQDSKLVSGVELFVVDPLPKEHQFTLRGYTQTPAGVSTAHEDYKAHPMYPPGEGAPQWDLCYYDQSHLTHVLSLSPDVRLRYMASALPKPR